MKVFIAALFLALRNLSPESSEEDKFSQIIVHMLEYYLALKTIECLT